MRKSRNDLALSVIRAAHEEELFNAHANLRKAVPSPSYEALAAAQSEPLADPSKLIAANVTELRPGRWLAPATGTPRGNAIATALRPPLGAI